MRHLLVISKVVPKIWARTNSAILTRWTRQVESKEVSGKGEMQCTGENINLIIVVGSRGS